MLYCLWTCVIKWKQHDGAKHDINRNTPGHLNIGLSMSFSVFFHWEPSLIQVFKWRGNIKAQEKVNKLVQIISPCWELSGGVNLYKKSDKYLCPCQDEEKNEGPLKRKSSKEWIGGRYSIRIVGIGVIPSVKISPKDCFLYTNITLLTRKFICYYTLKTVSFDEYLI